MRAPAWQRRPGLAGGKGGNKDAAAGKKGGKARGLPPTTPSAKAASGGGAGKAGPPPSSGRQKSGGGAGGEVGAPQGAESAWRREAHGRRLGLRARGRMVSCARGCVCGVGWGGKERARVCV